METAPTGDSPSLRQIQSLSPPRASMRKPALNIRRSSMFDNRYQYEVDTLDRCVRILFWCKKNERKEMEQSLIVRYEQYRVKFYVLK
jgi:hypothetical protein